MVATVTSMRKYSGFSQAFFFHFVQFYFKYFLSIAIRCKWRKNQEKLGKMKKNSKIRSSSKLYTHYTMSLHYFFFCCCISKTSNKPAVFHFATGNDRKRKREKTIKIVDEMEWFGRCYIVFSYALGLKRFTRGIVVLVVLRFSCLLPRSLVRFYFLLLFYFRCDLR